MTNEEYWRQREEEAKKHYLKEEADILKSLKKKYNYLLSQIEKEINGFYQKYANDAGLTLAEAKKAVAQMDVQAFAEKARKYVETKDFSPQANAELKLYNATMKINRLELLKANIGLEMIDTFDDIDKTFAETLTDRAIEEYERQAGILGDSVKHTAKAAKSLVNASFNHATFSDRIWMYQSQLKNELDNLLTTGLIQGRNPKVLARHLVKLMGATYANSERLMRTEMARVQTEAQKESFDENGFDQYMFLADLGSPRTCEICAALNGKIFKVKDMQPGENAPPMHPRCRCSTAAWMDREEVERELFSSDENNEELTNKYGQEITFDERMASREEQTELLKELIGEYDTRLLTVGVGAKNAAGTVDMSGAGMKLSSKSLTDAIHEFGHTLANSKADKYGLTNDAEFWKEIQKIRRQYIKDVEGDPSRWISSYEHGSKDIDEFFAEAFAHAKARQLGIELPAKYGKDFTYSEQVLTVADKYFKKNSVVNSHEFGIIKSEFSNIYSGGHRNEIPLTTEQISKAEEAAKRQGYDGDIYYSDYSNTSFHGSTESEEPFHYLVIGTDAYPSSGPHRSANDRISLDGCMAHEVKGHYETWKRGTIQPVEVLDEAQASIRASKYGIGLSQKEREMLYQDAIERLRNAGINLVDVEHELDIWEE